jgi:hypothetical protein
MQIRRAVLRIFALDGRKWAETGNGMGMWKAASGADFAVLKRIRLAIHPQTRLSEKWLSVQFSGVQESSYS